ncbi:tail fiber domain-containing protein [Ewingella sp. CoE-038-23]|uniref:tail fiber domain-containing protein n=1 Tax=Ewingella docleensis TaxID=3118588 RepID=UPI0033654334
MAWYRDGTVRVTNGSATVSGTGTLWGDNKQGIGPGQMLLVPAAGTVQVYEILRVDSNTQLTLKDNFVGTTAAASVYAIPSFYTDSVPDFARRLSAQLSYYQSQMDGWQQIMTGTGSVTLTTPNGQTVTISSFKKLTDDMSNKASLVNGAVPMDQGGTGATNEGDARKKLGVQPTNNPTFTGTLTAGIVALSTESTIKANGKNIIFSNGATDVASISSTGIFSANPIDSQGSFRSRRGTGGATGVNFWNFFYDGDVQVYVDSSNLGSITLRTASDKLLKKDIGYQETSGYLQEVMEWIPAKFKYIARGVIKESNEMLGFIANDLVKVSPDCVTGKGLQEGFDMLNPEGAYGLDQVAMIAKLTGAIHAQQAMIEALQKQVGDLTNSSEQTS